MILRSRSSPEQHLAAVWRQPPAVPGQHSTPRDRGRAEDAVQQVRHRRRPADPLEAGPEGAGSARPAQLRLHHVRRPGGGAELPRQHGEFCVG